MRQSIFDLREFYASPLGRVARQMISRKISEAWPEVSGADVLTLGYGTPYLEDLGPTPRRLIAAMPSAQGVEAWPTGERNLACLAEDASLPFANALFDRVLAIHAVEEADNPLRTLHEMTRILAPSGRIIVVVAARHGLWADAESSPFGHGRPFSRRQLERLVREAELEPVNWTRALYLPPLSWASPWAEGFEQIGARLWPRFAGLILMEAMKRTFAVRPKAQRARLAPLRTFQPVPIGSRVHVRMSAPRAVMAWKKGGSR